MINLLQKGGLGSLLKELAGPSVPAWRTYPEGVRGPVFEGIDNIKSIELPSMHGPILVLFEETGLFKGNFNVCIVPTRQNMRTVMMDAERIGYDVSSSENLSYIPKSLQIFIYTPLGVSAPDPAPRFDVVHNSEHKKQDDYVKTTPMGYLPEAISAKLIALSKAANAEARTQPVSAP